MITRIDPKTSAVFDDEYNNVQPGEFYVDDNNEIQCKGLEEE